LSPIFSLSKLSLSTDQTNQRSNFTAQPPWKEAKNLEISSSDKHYQVKKDLISSVKNEFRSQNEDTPPTPNLQREPTTRRTNRCRVVAKSVQVTAYNLFLSYLLGHFQRGTRICFCVRKGPHECFKYLYWMLLGVVLEVMLEILKSFDGLNLISSCCESVIFLPKIIIYWMRTPPKPSRNCTCAPGAYPLFYVYFNLI
jgi:hypothetical protein